MSLFLLFFYFEGFPKVFFSDYVKYSFNGKSHKPGESEDDILHHDGVVDVGAGVHQLLPQPFVSSIRRGKEAKVHLEIPEDGVEGGDDLAGEPNIV